LAKLPLSKIVFKWEKLNPSTRLFIKDKDISPSGQKFEPGDSAEPRHTSEEFLIPWVRYPYPT